MDYLPAITITAQHAERTEGQEIRFTLTADPAPSQSTEVKICVSQGNADYLTDGTPSPECDIAGPVDHTTNRVLAKIAFSAGSTSEELILQTEDDATGEPDGTIAAALLQLPGDTYTAGDPRTAEVAIKDNDALTLNVEPMPLRQARISWNLLPQAEGYDLEIQREGGTWTNPPTVAYTAEDSERIVDLDHILEIPAGTKLGTADGNFEFRIRAHQTVAGLKQYTGYSQTIRIVENPLTAPGGRAYVPNNVGTASLTWTPESNATDHVVQYRSLDSHGETIKPGSTPCTDRSSATPVFHNHDAWPIMPNWPNYEETAQTKALTGSPSEITGLTNCWLYALQLNYEVTDAAGTGKIKVFSANDAYVWPSPTKFPAANQQVATYPFFGHHASRTFNYAICTHTFEDDATTTNTNEQDRWVDIINEAFQKWSTATTGFITVSPYSPVPAGACASGPSDPTVPDYAFHMRLLMMADDQYNEVRMFDLTKGARIYSFPEFKSDVFKICITEADACVTSFTGYSALDPNDIQRRLDIAKALERRNLADRWNILFKYIPEASEGNLEPGEAIQSVDISFNKSGFKTKETALNMPHQESGNQLYLPTSSRYNTCSPDIPEPPGFNALPYEHEPYKAYELALHEAGHALGISSFNYVDFVTTLGGVSYHVAHPTIPDSAMNYDDEVRHPRAGADFAEPDCSPHPLDVMAIYALYQNALP